MRSESLNRLRKYACAWRDVIPYNLKDQSAQHSARQTKERAHADRDLPKKRSAKGVIEDDSAYRRASHRGGWWAEEEKAGARDRLALSPVGRGGQGARGARADMGCGGEGYNRSLPPPAVITPRPHLRRLSRPGLWGPPHVARRPPVQCGPAPDRARRVPLGGGLLRQERSRR